MANRKQRRSERAKRRDLEKAMGPQQAQPGGSSGRIVVQHTREIQESHTGPLPDAETLERYEALHPGITARLLDAFESEIGHRRGMEQQALNANIATATTNVSTQRLGQVFGFVIGIAGLGVALAAVFKGAETAAIGIGGTTLVSLVSVFIYGRRQRPKGGESAK